MKKFKILAAVVAAAVTVTMAGCGSGATQASTSEPETEEAATAETTVAEPVSETVPEEDTQNPVMNYAGAYSDEGGEGYSLLIAPSDGTDGAYVTVGHIYNEGADYTAWEMYGQFKDNVITYKDAVRVNESADPEAESGVRQETVYTDGTGSFEISEDGKITWKDDKENEGEGLVFAWNQELSDQVQEMIDENSDEEVDPASLTAMNWAGPYIDSSNENLSMEIAAEEENGTCQFSILKKGDGSEAELWTMSGTYDVETATVSYTDCVKKDVQIDEFGNIGSENVVYEGGSGSFTFNEEEQTVEWKDDKEDAGKDVKFKFNFNANGDGSEEGYEMMEGEVLEEPGEDFPAEEETTEDEGPSEEFMSEDADY